MSSRESPDTVPWQGHYVKHFHIDKVISVPYRAVQIESNAEWTYVQDPDLFAGLNCHPPHCVSSAVIGHTDGHDFAWATGLCLLALLCDWGLLRLLAGLALLRWLRDLTLVGKLVLLLLNKNRRGLF